MRLGLVVQDFFVEVTLARERTLCRAPKQRGAWGMGGDSLEQEVWRWTRHAGLQGTQG